MKNVNIIYKISNVRMAQNINITNLELSKCKDMQQGAVFINTGFHVASLYSRCLLSLCEV